MKAVDEGMVAVRASKQSGGRVLLHLVKPVRLPSTFVTVCGRYGMDRIEPEDLELPEDTPRCKVCTGVTRKTWRLMNGEA